MGNRVVICSLAVLMAFTVAGAAPGQDEDIIIARVSFTEPTYELWREWVADRLAELEGTMAESGQDEWGWFRKQVIEDDTVERHDGEQVLTFRQGDLDAGVSRRALAKWLRSFQTHALAEENERRYARWRDSAQMEVALLKGEARKTEQAMHRQERESKRALRGRDIDVLHRALQESDARMLELEMQSAELRARLEAIQRKLAEEKEASGAAAQQPDPLQLRARLQASRRAAEEQVDRVKALVDRGVVSSGELEGARRNLAEQELAIATSLKKLDQPVGENPVVIRLKEMLVEVETAHVGLEARREVVERHRAQLEVELETAYELDGRIGDLEQHLLEVAAAAEEREEELAQKDAGDFALEPPKLTLVTPGEDVPDES